VQAVCVRRFLVLALAACGAASTASGPVVTPTPAASAPSSSASGSDGSTERSSASASTERAPGPAEPAPVLTAPAATATSQVQRTWRARRGLDGCALGGTVARCRKMLGPDEDFFDDAMFPAIGVQVSFDNDLVTEIDIHYLRDVDTQRITLFTGTDAKGIGAASTPDDVLRAYGASPEVEDREPTKFGRWPKARLHILKYPRDGLLFMFVDGALGLVMLRAP
jgi:hypothetical protein